MLAFDYIVVKKLQKFIAITFLLSAVISVFTSHKWHFMKMVETKCTVISHLKPNPFKGIWGAVFHVHCSAKDPSSKRSQ